MVMKPEEILQRLEEIERRVNKATPGPWTWEDYSAGWSIVYARVLRKAAGKYQICDFAMHDDAEFIAGSREDTPWLCELARRLLAVAEAAREIAEHEPYLRDHALSGSSDPRVCFYCEATWGHEAPDHKPACPLRKLQEALAALEEDR